MTQGLNDFLSRIQTDYGFYLLFRQNPRAALGPYHLGTQERAALTESGVDVGNDLRLPLRPRLLPHSTSTTIHYLAPELSELGFDAAAAVRRTKIKRSLAQLRDAGSLDDRLAVLETLMRYIGWA
jgi:hypothetical protein